MSHKIPSLESPMPELAHGSVWLTSIGDGGPSELSPLFRHVLGRADAVIHDPDTPQRLLELMPLSAYREPAEAERAVERSIKLAQDGWRVAQLVKGNAVARVLEGAARFAEHGVPLRFVPNTDEAGGPSFGLLLVRRPLSVGRPDTRDVALLVVPPFVGTSKFESRQPPLGFSMSGLAG